MGGVKLALYSWFGFGMMFVLKILKFFWGLKKEVQGVSLIPCPHLLVVGSSENRVRPFTATSRCGRTISLAALPPAGREMFLPHFD